MDDLAELERLSLVSSVSSEIQNHTGIVDKNVCEYVIFEYEQASSFAAFKTKLGDAFSDSLYDSIDRLMKQSKAQKDKQVKSSSNGNTSKSQDVFKGLSLPDKDIEADFAALEELANGHGAQRKERREEFYSSRQRNGQRNRRSRSPDGYREHKRRDEDQNRRSRSPYGHEDRHRDRESYSIIPDPVLNGRSFQNGRNWKEDNVLVDEGRFRQRNHRGKKRMTSPERFEIQQLIASGAAKASDFPEFEEQYNASLNHGAMIEEEEDVDIELAEQEPPFLAGQTKASLELSPVRIIRAPEGSMNRAAMQGDNLARERRDLRQQEARDRAAQEASKADLQTQWQDPMVAPDQRQFASDFSNVRPSGPSSANSTFKSQNQKQEYGKRTNLSMREQREGLPVYKYRSKLLEAIRQNQVLIVVGETGSGKTTQLTQFLAEDGYGNQGIIGCTQPRRVAAVSVAKRVAEEVGVPLGQEVGYSIRFEDKTSDKTVIKYMTDGLLLREILVDPMMSKYSAIMIDEAHERVIATDVLMGLLKRTLRKRSDMKVIVTSATLDADKFSKYFMEAPIFTVPGRTYPVEILYSKEPETDYLDAALTTALTIHISEPPGDMLIFLTGKEEIDTACEVLTERMKALGPSVPELLILPIYSALPSEMQSAVFDPAPPGSRKCVVATNIAETSLTVDGITMVIDPGFVKQSAYDSKLQMDRLQVTPISQAQANQRAGRAGRTSPGKCFRLYTEHAFQNEMLPTTIPEIQRQHLGPIILQLKAMGINDLLHFDFMDSPPPGTMLSALEELYALDALDDEGFLTRLGRQMTAFPMSPELSKILISSSGRDMNCSDEILTIVSMISTQGEIFSRPRAEQQKADQRKARFNSVNGDHLTLLNVYSAWKKANYDFNWCRENFVQARTLKRARDVREQLMDLMRKQRLSVVSCGRDETRIRQALCAGLFRNSARKSTDGSGTYNTLTQNTPVYMHPSSALFGKAAEHVVYSSLVETSKEYMHIVTVIEPKWLVEAAPTFFKVAPSDRLSKRKKAEKIQPLHNKFAGEDDWRLSAQRRQGRGGGGGTWG